MVVLVSRRQGVVLVDDKPFVAVPAQAHRQPEEKAVIVRSAAGRVGSAPHDGDRKGDIRAGGDGEFTKIEGRAGLVVTEKQIPRLFVGVDTSALKRRRQVEHHNVPRVVRENGGKIVAADSIRPILQQGFDVAFGGFVLLDHGFAPVAVGLSPGRAWECISDMFLTCMFGHPHNTIIALEAGLALASN